MHVHFALSVMLLPVCAAAAADLPLKAGAYDVVATTVMRGRDGPPKSTARCLGAGDLASPERVFNNRFLAAFQADPTCSVRKFVLADARISYDAECKYSVDHVEGRVSGDHYAVTRSVKPRSTSSTPISIRLEGSRTGECRR
jgi:hypothetical protein